MLLQQIDWPVSLIGELSETTQEVSREVTINRPGPAGEPPTVPGRVLFKFGHGDAVVWVRINTAVAGNCNSEAGREAASVPGNPAGTANPGV
jgi:hypothetical protein